MKLRSSYPFSSENRLFFIFALNSLTDWLNILIQAEHDDSHYSSDYFDYERQEASPTEARRYGYDGRSYGTRQDVYGRDER